MALSSAVDELKSIVYSIDQSKNSTHEYNSERIGANMPRVKRDDRISEEKVALFLQRLVKIRTARGWSQTEMASFLETSTSYYNAIENGKKTLIAKTMVHIAKRLDDLPYVEELLGSKMIRRLVDEGSVAIRDLSREEVLLKTVENPELHHYVEGISRKIENTHTIFTVKLPWSMAWFGYYPEYSVATLKILTSMEQVKEDQLLYFVHRNMSKKGFVFVHHPQGQAPRLISPERKVIEYFRLPLEEKVLDHWKLDPRESLVSMSLPTELPDPELILCEVVCIHNYGYTHPMLHPRAKFMSSYDLKPIMEMILSISTWIEEESEQRHENYELRREIADLKSRLRADEEFDT